MVMRAYELTGRDVVRACRECRPVSPAFPLKWGDGMGFLDPAGLHRLARSLPPEMIAGAVRETTKTTTNGESAVLLPIFCEHAGRMIAVMKLLITASKCQALHVGFCDHQNWKYQKREGGLTSRMNLIAWDIGEAGEGNKAVENELKKWSDKAFKKCVATGNKPTPMVMEFVENPGELAQTAENKAFRTLPELMRKTPGFFYVVLGTSGVENTRRLVTPVKENKEEERVRSVIMMTWVPANVQEMLQCIQYTECDATFKSCRPYVAIVIQGVVHNVGVPLCLTIAPSERNISYKFAYQCIANALVRKGRVDLAQRLFHVPVLSDMGSALASFVQDYNLTQYWCHRHLIERFGASSFLTDVYKLVLISGNLKQANDIVQSFIRESQKTLEHCGASAARSLKMAMEKMEKTMMHYEKWSEESKLSKEHGFVARTTNHAEGFHKHMNAVTAHRRHPLTRIMEVLRLIMKKHKNFGESVVVNAHRKFEKLLGEARKQIELGADESLFKRKECTCGKRYINSYVYGTEFPCLCNIITFRECPRIEVQLKLTNEECYEEPVFMAPDKVWASFHIEVPKEWDFESSKERSGQVGCSRELDEFQLDLRARPWFTRLRNEIATKLGLSPDDATWKLVQYFYKQRVEIDRLGPIEMALHEFRLLNETKET